jgi:hypothetical protein
MKTKVQEKASTVEVEAMRSLTREQVKALVDVVRILRFLRAQRKAEECTVFERAGPL